MSTTTITDRIEDVFGTSTPMVEIARCESRLRHFKSPNVVLRGDITPADVGLYQINVDYHEDKIKELGINIYTVDGNIAYAKYLYDKNGTRDWNASKKCWAK